MKVVILGAGSIGSLFGGLLSVNENVTLICRPEHAEAVSANGLTLTGKTETVEVTKTVQTTKTVEVPGPTTTVTTTGMPGDGGEWKYGVCSGCFYICALKYKVEDGVIVEVQGNDNAPLINEGGVICGKGIASSFDTPYNPNRLLYPLKRVGKRGEGKFIRTTWDEAITEIVSYLKKRE